MEGYATTRITTDGYDGQVPNTWWFCGSDTLLVLLPGLGYTNQMPLMFYLHQLGTGRRWDILEIDYDYRSVPRDTTAAEWDARFIADVEPMLRAAIARGGYTRIVLAGKSIGTRVITSLVNHGFGGNLVYLWLTPLLISPAVYDAVKSHAPAVAVFGDADYAVQNVDLAPLANAGVSLIIVPEGDHGMSIPGDVPRSVAELARVLRELDTGLTHHTNGEPA